MISLIKKNKTTSQCKRCVPALGTYIHIEVDTGLDYKDSLSVTQNCIDKINEIESLMSFHNPNSELSYINANAHTHPCPLSPHMYNVITTALKLSQLSKGLFDITLPAQPLIKLNDLPCHGYSHDATASWKDICIENQSIFFKKNIQIDLGGIAKGYAVDYAFNSNKTKSKKITINAGGDMRTNHWKNTHVDIKYATHHAINIVSVKMLNASLATSGHYYTAHGLPPIISPISKKPAIMPYTISVFASTCMIADALTKIAWLMPKNDLLFRYYNVTVLSIDHDGHVQKI